jgi:hypothetical protein
MIPPVGGHRQQEGGKIFRIFGFLILFSTVINIILFGVLLDQPAASLVSKHIVGGHNSLAYTTSTAGTKDPKDKENNSCFTPRHVQSHDINHTIVYIEMAWYDLHSETFYSFINEICLCNAKDPLWTVHSVPHFYIGPDGFISWR